MSAIFWLISMLRSDGVAIAFPPRVAGLRIRAVTGFGRFVVCHT